TKTRRDTLLVDVHLVDGPPVAGIAAGLIDSDVTRGPGRKEDFRDRALAGPDSHRSSPTGAVAGNVNLIASRMIVFETAVPRIEHDPVECLRHPQVDLEELAMGLRRARGPTSGDIPVNSIDDFNVGKRRDGPAGSIQGCSRANARGIFNPTGEMLQKE